MPGHAWIAWAVAAALVALWAWRRTASAGVVALLWLAYGVYEQLMTMRVLCTGECNIRVDLLLLYPLLLVATLVALWRALRRRPRAR